MSAHDLSTRSGQGESVGTSKERLQPYTSPFVTSVDIILDLSLSGKAASQKYQNQVSLLD